MFKKGITYFTLGIIVVIWLWLFFLKSSITQYEQVEVVKTDTVYMKKSYKEIIIKEVEVKKPVKVFIYKTDTLYRQKLEKDTLISAIQIERKKATIHSVTPKGIPLIKEYPLDDFKELTINHEGDLKQVKLKKKSKFKRNVNRGIFFLMGIFIGSKFN